MAHERRPDGAHTPPTALPSPVAPQPPPRLLSRWPLACRVSGSVREGRMPCSLHKSGPSLTLSSDTGPADCVGTAFICKSLAFWTQAVNPGIKLSTEHVMKAAKGQKRRQTTLLSQTGWAFSQKGEGGVQGGKAQTCMSPEQWPCPLRPACNTSNSCILVRWRVTRTV